MTATAPSGSGRWPGGRRTGSSRRDSSRRRRSRPARSATTGWSARRPSAELPSLSAARCPAGRRPPRWRRKRWRSRAIVSPGRKRAWIVVVLRGHRLLEALDERLHVRVALHGEIYLTVVVGARALEVRGVDGHADQPLELADQGQRRLRVGGGGDVMGDGGPQAGRRETRLLAGGVEHADDPGGSLVEDEASPSRATSAGSEARPGHGHRTGVGDVGEERSEGDHELGAERFDQLDDHLAESAPAERGLAAGEQDQIPRRPRHSGFVQLDLWPLDLPGTPLGQLDARPRGLEVVELLGIDRREPARPERGADESDRARGRVSGVVPAFERADHGRGAQPVRTVFPSQRLHPAHRTSWAYEPSVRRSAPFAPARR